MIYLNENDINKIGIKWDEIINQIEEAVRCLDAGDFAQPIKPYLRYGDFQNRIIAMPAFVGGCFNIAGIKWIASFPQNIEKNIPRAHSVVVLNNADTGVPVCIVNTAKLSIIRTAAVSGTVIKHFVKARNLKEFKLGIIGWGPIGQNHFNMCTELFGEKISDIYLYDIRPVINKEAIDYPHKHKINIANSWQDVYNNSNVFITCTVSKAPYIDLRPQNGSLLLNVSLRDFKVDIYDYVRNSIIVDDWDEACREKTDIEMMNKEKGLAKEDVKTIIDIVCNDCIRYYDLKETVMFNPMGMAIFDIAIGRYYYNKSKDFKVGQELL